MTDKEKDSVPITAADVTAAVSAGIAAATAPLQEQIAALQNNKPEPEPAEKAYTRVELDQAVEDNKITLVQAQDIMDRQTTAQTAKQINDSVQAAVATIDQGNKVEDEIDLYVKLVPAIETEGSDDRKRVADQFKHFIKIGLPNDKSTELAALNSIYGSIESLKSAKGAKQEFDTHVETPSAGGDDTVDSAAKDLKLSVDEKRYYKQLIDNGQYKDWDEVAAEMKYADKRVRASGARAAA